MKSNLCLFYGAIVKTHELNNLIGKETKDDLYTFFMKNGLVYRIVGEYTTSGTIIVGKEIIIESNTNFFELHNEKGNILLEQLSGKITVVNTETEDGDLKRKLISIGIISPLKYYFFNSYDVG